MAKRANQHFINLKFFEHGVAGYMVTTQNEQMLAALYLLSPYKDMQKHVGQMLVDGFDYDEFEKKMYEKMGLKHD